ncbi:MAG TPA: RNA polymerase sigma factor [Thermodesulfobacteriota bacterium]
MSQPVATVLERNLHHDPVAKAGDRDRLLVEALRRRAPASVERLCTRYGDRVLRLATRITGNEQDAEEVAQDAFWAAVRKIDTFRGQAAFGSWLYRIVVNAAYEKLRVRRGRRVGRPWDEARPPYRACGAATAEWPAHDDDPGRRIEWRMALASAIDDLPVDYRTVLLLHDVEGWSSAEIARVLGLGVPAVKSRVRRARLLVRRRVRG